MLLCVGGGSWALTLWSWHVEQNDSQSGGNWLKTEAQVKDVVTVLSLTTRNFDFFESQDSGFWSTRSGKVWWAQLVVSLHATRDKNKIVKLFSCVCSSTFSELAKILKLCQASVMNQKKFARASWRSYYRVYQLRMCFHVPSELQWRLMLPHFYPMKVCVHLVPPPFLILRAIGKLCFLGFWILAQLFLTYNRPAPHWYVFYLTCKEARQRCIHQMTGGPVYFVQYQAFLIYSQLSNLPFLILHAAGCAFWPNKVYNEEHYRKTGCNSAIHEITPRQLKLRGHTRPYRPGNESPNNQRTPGATKVEGEQREKKLTRVEHQKTAQDGPSKAHFQNKGSMSGSIGEEPNDMKTAGRFIFARLSE